MSTDFTNRPRYESQLLPSRSHAPTPLWQSDKSLRVMLSYVRGLIESIVRKQQPTGLLPPELANQRVMGMAMTATRAGEPRCHAIRYTLPAQSSHAVDFSLSYLLGYLASALAAGGENEPRLSPHELAYLGLEITLLHEPKWVKAEAEDRLKHVLPELHGVVVDHPMGRAILLPQTPSAMALQDDASRMLDRVSTLAGLGPDAWRRDPQSRLLTFQTHQTQSEPALAELGSLTLSGSRVQSLLDAMQRALSGQSALESADEIIGKISPLFMAVGVTTAAGGFVWAGGKARTLVSLARAVGLQLHPLQTQAQSKSADPGHEILQLTACWLPILLEPADPHATRHLAIAPKLHLQSPQDSRLIQGGQMSAAQINAWHQGNLTVTALTTRTYAHRTRRKPPTILSTRPPATPRPQADC